MSRATAGIFRGRPRLSFWRMSQIGGGRSHRLSEHRFINEHPNPIPDGSKWLSGRAGTAHRAVGYSAMSQVVRSDRAGSGGFAVVMLQESTEPFLALNLPRRERQRGRFGFLLLRLGCSFRQRNVADSLVRAFFVIMFHERFGNVAQMLLTENDKVVKQLMTQRLSKPFGEGVQVGSQRPDSLDLAVLGLEHGVELVSELGVVVDQQVRRGQAPVRHLHRSIPGLLRGPLACGVGRGSYDEGTTTANVDEEEQVEIDEAREGGGLHGEEIAGPQRRSVNLDELIPSSFATLGSGIEARFLQDVDHRGTAHTDAEFLEFSEHAGVTPLVLLREFDDECSNLLGGLGATGLASGLLRRGFVGVGLLAVAGGPASEGAVRHDGDEVFERRSDLLSEFEEASAFAVCYGNSVGQFLPQNPILLLEVFDRVSEFLVA